MKFGIIGLGKMDGGLALQAIEKGHHVVGYNESPETTQNLAQQGLEPAFSLDELAVLAVSEVGWSDWGSPQRVLSTLARMGVPAGWARDLSSIRCCTLCGVKAVNPNGLFCGLVLDKTCWTRRKKDFIERVWTLLEGD